MNPQISTALISFGKASRVFHAPIITSLPDFKLATVLERNKEESRSQYPWVQVVRDLAEILTDNTITLVVITTPNETHYELAKQCLEAGKHVIVDKPITTTVAELQHLLDLAAQHKRIICAFQNRRWDGDFLTVKKLLAGGALGRLVEFESHFDRFRPAVRQGAWREEAIKGSGILYDLGPHMIDQAVTLFGRPDTVTADLRMQRDNAVTDDYFELLLNYHERKLRVRLTAGMLVRSATPRFRLSGTKGSFTKYGLDPQEAALVAGRRPDGDDWGMEAREAWGELDSELNDLHFTGKVDTEAGDYREFYRNIAAAMQGDADTAVRPEEMLTTMQVIEAAFCSSKEGRQIPL